MTSPFPITIGVTGGIGSGKSHVCRLLESGGAPVFYTDTAAKQIIRTHPLVQEELRRLVGKEVYDEQGALAKSVLAAYLCRGRAFSRQVDAIVHPRVAEAWKAFVHLHAATLPRPAYIYMECALLFESGFNRLVDKTLLVQCPQEERIRRVMERDGFDRETVSKWMSLQMSETEKERRSDLLLLNDGHTDIRGELHRLSLR